MCGKPFIIGVIGFKNTGKTTLVEKIVCFYKGKGYTVGYIKHDPKGHGVTDKEGSDTFRVKPLTDRTLLVSPDVITLWDFNNKGIDEIIRDYFSDFDIVVVEGFKNERSIPKIAIGDVEGDNIFLRVGEGWSFNDIIKKVEELRNDKDKAS